MQENEDKKEEKGEIDTPFKTTIRINVDEGYKKVSREMEKHLKSLKVKPIIIKL